MNFFLSFIKAKSCKNSSKLKCLSLSLSMHRMVSADNLSGDTVNLNSFLFHLSLEKDLSTEQFVTIKLRNTLNNASTLGKAV